MTKKKLLGFMVIATVLAMTLLPVPAHASRQVHGNVEISPLWDNVSFVDASISFSGNTANLYAAVFAFSGTTSISGTVRLERRVGNAF